MKTLQNIKKTFKLFACSAFTLAPRRHAEFISASIQHTQDGKIPKRVRDDVVRVKSKRHSLFPISHFHSPAFTLAEVLITLAIIGVVAAMTIPTLIQEQKERATVTALKETYSMLEQAFKLAVLEDGTPDNWDLIASSNSTGANNLLNNFKKHLKYIKICGTTTNTTCFANGYYKGVGGKNLIIINNSTENAKATLNNGVSVSFCVRNKDCAQTRGSTPALSNVCGTVFVDINGAKPPNTLGKDGFDFLITKYGIVPHGTNLDTMFSFGNGCKDATLNSTTTGYSCTAWVLYNENMDYLHCSGLSWGGKTKCD